MFINCEITTATKSDTIPSKEFEKGSQKEIIPVNSGRNSESGLKLNIPSFNKILVTYDRSKKSDEAIKYSIYLSNISKAQIVILQVMGNLDKLEDSSIDVSNRNKEDPKPEGSSSNSTNESDVKDHNYSVNIEGEVVKSMEDKIKEIESTGFKNRVSYKIRAGFVVDEIVKETKEAKYDLLIISSSHMNSWIRSLFSETRKVISNVSIPVLLLH
ncbi:hypothetical protein BH23THE1_BH23THE1_29070 [soil metagenome]